MLETFDKKLIWSELRQLFIDLGTGPQVGPGVSLYLLHENTGHPWLPRVKLVQKTHISALVQSSVSDAVLMVPQGWDIGPTSPMGPSPWPSWNARSHGHLHEGQPLYIHSYTGPQVKPIPKFLPFSLKSFTCSQIRPLGGSGINEIAHLQQKCQPSTI